MHTPAPYVRFATVYENKVLITYEPIDGKRHKFTKSEYHKNPTNAKYTGVLNKTAQKKIDKKLHGWVYAMLTAKSNRNKKSNSKRYKPTFVTLTLSATQKHSDKEIKSKILEIFLKRAQRYWNVKHYFWRAEVQENGNLHFHLILDKYIDKSKLQKAWNDSQQNLGYIDRFEQKHHHRNPPSTNVKKLYGNSANIWYLLKYVGKEHTGRLIEGAVFRFSQSLREVKPLKILLDWSEAKKLRMFVKGKVQRVFNEEFFSIVYFKKSTSLLPFFDSLGNVFQEVAERCFKHLYPEPQRQHLQNLVAPLHCADLNFTKVAYQLQAFN